MKIIGLVVLQIAFYLILQPVQAAVDRPLRDEVCLNGTWNLELEGIEKPAQVRVPGSFAGQNQLWGKEHWDVWDYPEDWAKRPATYVRSIQVPKNLGSRRVLIHIGGVRHVVKVSVNGKEVGTWWDSYVPFEFDITDAVKPGTNELRVQVSNAKSCGLFEDYNSSRRGIYRDVFLKFVPDVRVTPDLFVKTSVKRAEIACEVPVRNDKTSEQTVGLSFKVLQKDGTVVKSWVSPEKLTIPSGEEKILSSTEPWRDAHLWSIDDPHLYFLETDVIGSDGKVLDKHRQRFGFREITSNGPHLYLNGNEIFLRGNGNHPLGDLEGGKEYSEAMVRQLKSQGVELMRLHDLPRHKEIYDAADEMGFLLISEASHHFRMPPDDLAKAHIEHLVKWLRNRPSVMMWSVSNELHWRNFPEPVFLIELCHQLDPTRPAFTSDFCEWSRHGDVLSKHYDASAVWSDWEKFGPDKPMVWDEIGNVWQQDRPLKTGPAGYEISSQDVAAGIWRDGWEQLRNDILLFADGKVINGQLYRVNLYAPWEFCYSFFRHQPFNNMQRLQLNPGDTSGLPSIKPAFIEPCATTINVWDPTLPENQPNPGLYCFDDFLKRVRFPDDPKERTWFSGEKISRQGRLFYEDHRPADEVEFRVESPDGKVLASAKRAVSLKPGEYLPVFESAWTLPSVETATPVRLVRQFSNKGATGYRQVSDAKIFPPFQKPDLAARQIAVIGEPLQKLLGGAGVPLDKAIIIVAEAFDPAWEPLVEKGVRVLVQPSDLSKSSEVLSHLSIQPSGELKKFSGPVKAHQMAEGLTLRYGTSGNDATTLGSKKYILQSPQPASWVAFEFRGTLDFSTVGRVMFGYSLWTNPGTGGYEKQWKDAGGAPFYKKTTRLLIKDAAGNWFVSDKKDAQAIERLKPTPFKGTLSFDCPKMTWLPVSLKPTGLVETGGEGTPDLSRISGVGFVLDESNPGAEMQFEGLDLAGGASPAAYVQPGGVAHRLLDGLGQEDFSFWRGGSSSSRRDLSAGRNARRILFGNKDGLGSALQEFFLGRGVILESALNLGDLREPASGFLLERMIDYLGEYHPADRTRPLVVVEHNGLLKWLQNLGADARAAKLGEAFALGEIVVVDARSAKSFEGIEDALAAHLKASGTVIFSQVTPETIGTVTKLVGKPLRLTDPFFGQRACCIKAPVSWTRIDTPHQWVDYYDGVLVPYPFEPNYSPLLAGMANIDLEWNGKPMFTNGIEIEGMNPVSPGKDHQILISNWHIGSESTNNLYGEMLNGVRDLRQNTWFVNRDPVLLEVSANGGRALISQLDLSAGGEKSSRVMQTLLTNLGVPFCGASPMTADKAYAAGGREDQLKRLAAHDARIAPAKRQFYGTPNPMPDFLVGTNIGESKTAVALPLMGFFGDSVTLGLAGPLTQKLKEVVRMDKPAVLSRSSLAAVEAKAAIGDKKYSRVVFTLGESDLDSEISDADFLKNLEALWKTLAASSEKLYWIPIPSASHPSDAMLAERAKHLNQISEQFFEGKDVYKVPFIYAKAGELPPGYVSGQGKVFQPTEAQAIADRLGEAVISFGAQ
ncbi:MAG: hypothetical protein EBS96_03150 [Spartobacteria bacterium]|nr:hypothetical protein [Spartobacteria bacterium]